VIFFPSQEGEFSPFPSRGKTRLPERHTPVPSADVAPPGKDTINRDSAFAPRTAPASLDAYPWPAPLGQPHFPSFWLWGAFCVTCFRFMRSIAELFGTPAFLIPTAPEPPPGLERFFLGPSHRIRSSPFLSPSPGAVWGSAVSVPAAVRPPCVPRALRIRRQVGMSQQHFFPDWHLP